MNEAIYSFEPNVSELSNYMVLGFILFIICAGLFYYSLKKHKKLLLLFSGFIGVTALGIGIFSYINQTKLPIVQLYENGLSTPQGKVTFDQIRKIELTDIEKNTIFPSEGDTSKLIIIEEYSKKVHVLAEDNYPLLEIFGKLDGLIKIHKEKKEASEE